MNRWITAVPMMSLGLIVSLPGNAGAQASLQVQLYWEWGDGGWRSYEPGYHYGREREDVYYEYAAPRPIRVPPGHMPPPGYCRLWYPGVPPGHQPPPAPCGRVFRAYAQNGAVIVGAPAYEEVYGGYSYGDGRGNGHVKFKAPKKAKMRGRGG
ncbi:MAG: hypothetical protein ACYC6F_11750 [Longimicrobiales bacterium]